MPLNFASRAAVLRALVKIARHSPSIWLSSRMSVSRSPTSSSVCAKSLYSVPQSS
jgi:hypothetical protein